MHSTWAPIIRAGFSDTVISKALFITNYQSSLGQNSVCAHDD